MKEKREKLYYIVAAAFVIAAIGLDIYLIANGGSNVIDKVTLADNWTGGFFDWLGIILFNACCLSLAAGFVGMWEQENPVGSAKWNWISFAVAAGSLLMIYIV